MERQKHDMEYNSDIDKLIFPEYGRNVQKLVQYAKTVEDDEYRQRLVERILDLIQQMNPQYKDTEELRSKLWKHIFRMAEFDLSVKVPEGLDISRETFFKTPDIIDYPSTEARFRHYGHNVQELIRKAIAMEDPVKKKAFIEVIGSYMKLAYKTWNREHYVSDDVIISDLRSLSNGKLEIDDDIVLAKVQTSSSSKRKPKRPSGKGRGHKGGRNGRQKKRK